MAALCKVDVPPVSNYGVLPPDMLYDIMLLLPADVLCRLRLVCKPWRSLTSDSVFIKAHASRHPLLVAASHSTGEIHVVDLSGNIVKKIRPSQLTSRRLFDSLGSRDHNTQLDLFGFEATQSNYNSYVVLNLATGTVAANVLLQRWGAKHPYEPTSIVGYVPCTGEYKVLRIHHHLFSQNNSGHTQTCEVIALGGKDKGRWMLRCNGSIVVETRSRHSAVVGGAVYFLVNTKCTIVRPDSIACFDLATEAWRTELLPGPVSSLNLSIDEAAVHNGTRIFRLATLGGYLVTVDCNLRNRLTDLWFLDKSLWTKRYSMRDPPPWNLWLPFNLNEVSFPLEVLSDGRIIVWAEVSRVLRLYDPQKDTWHDLSEMKDYNAMSMLQGSLLSSSVRQVVCD
ncbi:hypothetical protein EJB05_52474, partial [Eragrostis curvula]